MVFPYAPSYREPIYRLMDEAFDCTFYFCGNSNRGLKYMNYGVLKNVNTQLKETFHGPFRFYNGISKIDFSEYDVVMHPGTLRNPSAWYMMMKIHLMRKRPQIAIWTHGWYGKESRIEMFLKKVFFRLVDRIYVYGNYARNGLISHGIPQDKIVTIYNSLDYEKQLGLKACLIDEKLYKCHFGNDYPVLIMIGRLNMRKKLDMLLNSVATLKNNGEKFNVVFIGEGEDRTKLERLTSQLNLSNNVWFYGACFDERLNAKLLYNADMCIVPGDIGLTAIHAMTFGVPVISHNQFMTQGPEFETIKPGLTGDFFEHDNMNSLCSTISNWFRLNADKRECVRQACYNEIACHWTPFVQLNILKNTL